MAENVRTSRKAVVRAMLACGKDAARPPAIVELPTVKPGEASDRGLTPLPVHQNPFLPNILPHLASRILRCTIHIPR